MTAEAVPTTVVFAGGYAELAEEIRSLGLMRRRPLFYAVLSTIIVLAMVGAVAGLVLLRHSWWAVLLAPVSGVLSAQLGFFAHDAAHRQISRKERPSRMLGLLSGNLLNGLSYGWWLTKHNSHHAHPNDLESDPDVYAGVVVFDREQGSRRRGVAGWVTKYQAWLFLPMLTLEGLNLHASSIRAVLRPGLRHRRVEAVLLTLHFAGYVALLALTLSWSHALVFFVVHQAVFGVYLGCSFAPGHKGMPVLEPEQAADPLLRQVLTSRNVRGGHLVSAVMGGLNFQIEHHLFPSMPRPHLYHAQRVVRRFCEDRGVSYEVATIAATYAAVARHLDAVGSDLRGATRAH
jgi:fatty acid desaturase